MRKRLQTTVSPETYEIIEKYKEEYGSVSSFIEEAINYFVKRGGDQKTLDNRDEMLIKLIRELDLTACSKDQYRYLVLGDKEKAVNESLMEIAMEYISNKPMDELTLVEFLEALKKAWEAVNRVDYIKYEVGEDGKIVRWLCYHSMKSTVVSEFLYNHITVSYTHLTLPTKA